MKSAAGLTLADFPEPLLADIERYLGGLAALGRKDQNGRRRRPCKPSTILMRKRELMAAVRMADKVGVPVKDITSIAALVHPDVAEKVLDGYWRQDGEVPKTYTINLSERFVASAERSA
jgi:hypothetical protein